MSTPRVLITGITGQDGRHLARIAAAEGYAVHGTSRGSAAPPEVFPITIHQCDLRGPDQIVALIDAIRPRALFNFAGFSTGQGMFDQPEQIGDVNGLAVTRLLEAIFRVDPTIRFCQASSSEMFGHRSAPPQNEDTPFQPRSPYGAAKLYAHAMVDVYRQRHGLFACSAILFNHESPLRPPSFVTRKITAAAAAIKLGLAGELVLGDLEARRDWGYAGDHMRAMWAMTQAERASDYVVATGRTHSVRDLCALAFERVGLDYRDHVHSDPGARRPREDVSLHGDPGRLMAQLGWRPQLAFADLVYMMVDADLATLTRSPSSSEME